MQLFRAIGRIRRIGSYSRQSDGYVGLARLLAQGRSNLLLGQTLCPPTFFNELRYELGALPGLLKSVIPYHVVILSLERTFFTL